MRAHLGVSPLTAQMTTTMLQSRRRALDPHPADGKTVRLGRVGTVRYSQWRAGALNSLGYIGGVWYGTAE
jgi:hypothetical protein